MRTVLGALVLCLLPAGAGAEATLPPPVPIEALRPRAPQPQWDTGLWAGACGVGRDELWQTTRFCGGAVVDVTFLRSREQDGALGLYAGVGSVDFADGRYGLGALGLVPLGDLLVVQGSAGPYLHSDGSGASPGIEGRLSLGLRALNQSGHYGHAHALVLGLEHTPGDTSRAGTTLSLALRVDAFWLAMPLGRVFH